MSLSPSEKIHLVREVYSLLKVLTEKEALAGIVLTDDTFEQFKQELGFAALPYFIADATLDPAMEHTFVIDGLLVMRGTQLED